MLTDWETIDWEDHTQSWVHRPTEVEAFMALRLMAKVSNSGGYTDILSPLENQVHQLEIAVKRTHPALRTRFSRAEYISQTHPELHAGPWQISSILDEVEKLMRDIEQYRQLEEVAQRAKHKIEHATAHISDVDASRISEDRWRDLVEEVMREDAGLPVQMPLWIPLETMM